MKTNEIERIVTDQEELEALVDQARTKPLSEDGHRRVKAAIETLGFLMRELERERVSVARLKRVLFGSRSEKTRKLFDEETDSSEDANEEPGAGVRDEGEKNKRKRKGHGRNGRDAYSGGEKVKVPHERLKAGDPCPESRCRGTVYEQAPGTVVRIKGRAPVWAKVFEPERLRCNLCGTVFTAKLPEEAGEKKYDENAASIIALLHYGSGLPFNRLEGLQKALGIPLPASTQWEIMERLAREVEAAHEELIRQAAQGHVLYNDDTTMTVLELVKENEERRKEAEEQAEDFG